MKLSRLTIFALIMAIGFFMVACGEQKPAAKKQVTTSQDVKKEAKELADTALAYSLEQKEKYTQEVLEKLSKYNQQFNALDRKVGVLGEQAKKDMMGEIANVNAKKNQVTLKMRELQASTGKAWEDVKIGLDKAVDDLEESYKQAMSRY